MEHPNARYLISIAAPGRHAGPVSMALPTIPVFSGNDMARIGKRVKLVRAI
jgi:hypothetical protein